MLAAATAEQNTNPQFLHTSILTRPRVENSDQPWTGVSDRLKPAWEAVRSAAGLNFRESWPGVIDRFRPVLYHPTSMTNPNLDELQATYKQAVNQWVIAIRAEEALATPDHSETAMEHWDSADFAVQDAAKRAKEARDAYKGGLRQLNYGF
jgi:hypothetical protein